MNILLCHNYYQQRGGEDQSFEDEARLLEEHGHTVHRFTVHNDDIETMSRWTVARKTLWNRETKQRLQTIIRQQRPEVMHCTNTFPLISPAAYSAARAEGVAVVQSLRNYRLLCPSAFFMRNGKVCEDCLGKRFAWPSLLHGCYRGSRSATAVVATMQTVHRAARTWHDGIDLFYTLTEFARQKFVEGGFPANKIVVKQNFVAPDPGIGEGAGGYAVFVGRLSPEKGIDTLLAAWSGSHARQSLVDGACPRSGEHDGISVPLKIIGDGPCAAQVEQAAQHNSAIHWLGKKPLAETLSIVGNAAMLIMPSIWYETFGRTIIEAYAKGTPVVASNLGAMSELVRDGETGRQFQPGDAKDLAAKVGDLLAGSRRLSRMRIAARSEYEQRYRPETNYHLLMDIYRRAILRQPTRANDEPAARLPILERTV